MRQHGAQGDGKSDDTEAIQEAVDTCAKQGGGTVLFPPGRYITGTIELRSHVHLHLEHGSTIEASGEITKYRVYNGRRLGVFYGRDVEDLAFTGTGVLDGRADHFSLPGIKLLPESVDRSRTRQKDRYLRPSDLGIVSPIRMKERPLYLVALISCRGIRIEGVRFLNSPAWAVQVLDSTDVVVQGVVIDNGDLVPNADGLHFDDCKNIIIANCIIRSPDDCIAFTGLDPVWARPLLSSKRVVQDGVTENVMISNCILRSLSSAIRLGHELHTVRHVLVQNVRIQDTNRGIGIFVRGEASVEDVTMTNLDISTVFVPGIWWGAGEPIHISVARAKADVPPGSIKGIRFVAVNARGNSCMLLRGSSESPLQEVSLRDVRMNVTLGPFTRDMGGNLNLRPVADRRDAIFASEIPAILAQHVRGAKLEDIDTRWDNALPDYFTSAIRCENSIGLDITDCRVSQNPGSPDAPAVALANCQRFSIRGCATKRPLKTFLRLTGDSGRPGFVTQNDFTLVEEPISAERPLDELSIFYQPAQH